MGMGVCLLMFFKQRKIWACSAIIIIFFFGCTGSSFWHSGLVIPWMWDLVS